MQMQLNRHLDRALPPRRLTARSCHRVLLSLAFPRSPSLAFCFYAIPFDGKVNKLFYSHF